MGGVLGAAGLGSAGAPSTQHANDAETCQAQSDLPIAYDDAAGRAPTDTYPGPTDLGRFTMPTSGVYQSPESFAITGTLTLAAQGVRTPSSSSMLNGQLASV